MIALPITCATVGALLPFTPIASTLGFAALPLSFFLILLGMIATYLVLVEIVKARFYAAHELPRRQHPSSEQKRHRHIHRRARRFTHHTSSALAARSHS